jgi:hypothetical protein
MAKKTKAQKQTAAANAARRKQGPTKKTDYKNGRPVTAAAKKKRGASGGKGKSSGGGGGAGAGSSNPGTKQVTFAGGKSKGKAFYSKTLGKHVTVPGASNVRPAGGKRKSRTNPGEKHAELSAQRKALMRKDSRLKSRQRSGNLSGQQQLKAAAQRKAIQRDIKAVEGKMKKTNAAKRKMASTTLSKTDAQYRNARIRRDYKAARAKGVSKAEAVRRATVKEMKNSDTRKGRSRMLKKAYAARRLSEGAYQTKRGFRPASRKTKQKMASTSMRMSENKRARRLQAEVSSLNKKRSASKNPTERAALAQKIAQKARQSIISRGIATGKRDITGARVLKK